MTHRLEHDWFPAELPPNVELGAGSWLHSAHAFQHYRSDRGVQIGDHSGVYVGTYFELGAGGTVDIGNYCSVVGAIIATDGRVEIGDYAFVAHEVVFAATAFALPPAERPGGQTADITVGPLAWIGTRAILLGGAVVGEGAIVGAGAVVTGQVPAYSIVAGNPARVVGGSR